MATMAEEQGQGVKEQMATHLSKADLSQDDAPNDADPFVPDTPSRPLSKMTSSISQNATSFSSGSLSIKGEAGKQDGVHHKSGGISPPRITGGGEAAVRLASGDFEVEDEGLVSATKRRNTFGTDQTPPSLISTAETENEHGNISMETAFNRSDVAEIERQHAELAAASRMEEEYLLESFEATNAAWAFLDTDEGEDYGCDEVPNEAAPTAAEVAARLKRVVDAKAEKGLPKRNKLSQKSAPQPTNYTDNALLPKVEVKRRRLVEAEAKAKRPKGREDGQGTSESGVDSKARVSAR